MKHTLSFLLFFMLSFGMTAQSPTENYIKRTIYTAPSTQGITENDTLVSVTYFDGLGRPKQTVSVRGGFDRLSHNLIPWKRNWTVGGGGTPFFNQNGQASDNERIMGDNPFGKSALLWRCGNDPESDADGGWATDYFPVDNTVGYRYTVWVKRVGGFEGHTHHGIKNVNTLAGLSHNNPYFWSGDPPQLEQWYLLVGIVHPYDYIGGDSGISGVYDMQGNKVLDGTEFKWDVSTSTTRLRNYLFYSTDTNVRQYFYNPILQKLDGSEASLEDILYERGAPDIVTPIVYDAFGRQTKEYLPYPAATQNGNIHPNPLAELEAFYTVKHPGTTNPYSEKILEASPLGRVMEQGAPGTPWMVNPTSDTDHTIKFTYGTNTTDEVRLYRVTTTGNSYAPPLSTFTAILEEDGFYLPGRLYKTITKDENWQPGDEELHTTEEFKDFQGRVVLKRTYNTSPLGEPQGTVAHDTYYVYDDYGNLSFVIPPKVDASDGVSLEELSALCYSYVYDHRNRLVAKKLPGKGWESIVYNKGNRPVFTQDQQLLTQGKWLFTKYDKFGRVLYTGLYASSDSRETLQTMLEGHNPIYDHKTDTPILIEGKQVYYTNAAFPNTDLELLTINYYDTYTFDLDGAIEEDAYGVTPTTKTKTLSTGTKVRVLGTDHWITTVSWYDEKARPIYSYTHNPYLNTIDKVKHKVNFIGNILETTTEHSKDGQAPITTIEKFTYDRMGRLLTHTHQITGQAEESLAENSYDALGQLIQKNVGNTPVAPLQTVDYSYNIRGWLTEINDVSNLQNDLFGFQLHYDDPTIGTALYNGNISQTHWRTNNTDSSLKNYTYAYDPLNRITQAIDNTGNYNLNSISYDKNGNILSLNRQGHLNEIANTFGLMDQLTYSYDSGNKLLKVEDTADDTFGFKDDAINTPDTTPDYTYDDNGNMLSDTNKNITGIAYNHLNLPTEITFNADPNQKINYFYSADGIKQQKVVTDSGVTTITAYTGGTVYENGSLKFINHAEGYIEPDGAGSYDYVYQYKDHLGNIRLSYSDSNGDGVVAISELIEESNYYPFGLLHRGYNNVTNGTENRLLTFNGVELEESLDLNMYEMDLRHYDPAIARFTSIDPVIHYSMGTYNAFDNNPIFFADPSGADGEHYNWSTGRYEDNQGNEVSFEQALASVGLNSNSSESPDDTYKLSKNGKIEKVDEKKYYDKNGNEVDKIVSEETGKSKYVANGTFDTLEHKEEGTDWQVFKLYTNTNYTPFKTLYKWLIENSNVEFSLTYFNREGYITTSYSKGSEGGEKELLIDLYGKIPSGITIKSVHNHPSGAAFPSEGDKSYASMFKKLYSENTLRFYVIANGTNKYIEFDEKGIVND